MKGIGGKRTIEAVEAEIERVVAELAEEGIAIENAKIDEINGILAEHNRDESEQREEDAARAAIESAEASLAESDEAARRIPRPPDREGEPPTEGAESIDYDAWEDARRDGRINPSISQPDIRYRTEADLLASYSEAELKERQARIEAAEKEQAKLQAELAKQQAALNRPVGVAKNPKAIQDDLFNNQGSLFQRARRYDTQTLDLFTSQLPAATGARPDPATAATTERARLGAAADAFMRGRAGSLLGLAFTADWIVGRGSSLVGKTVSSPADLATLAAVLRDPRVETFRYFLMKGKRIVHHEAVSSRLYDSSAPWTGGDSGKDAFLADIRAKMERMGADGYYLMHNHPSTEMRPSDGDIRVTAVIADTLPGFKGHIVLDHGQFVLLERGNAAAQTDVGNGISSSVLDLPVTGSDPTRNAAVPHPVLGEYIDNPSMLATIADRVRDPDNVILAATDARLRVVAISSVPRETIRKGGLGATYAIGRLRKAGGSNAVFAVLPKGMNVRDVPRGLYARGWIMDASAIGVNGVSVSAAEQGATAYGTILIKRDRPGLGRKVEQPSKDYGTGDLFAAMSDIEREEIARAQRANGPQMSLFDTLERAQNPSTKVGADEAAREAAKEPAAARPERNAEDQQAEGKGEGYLPGQAAQGTASARLDAAKRDGTTWTVFDPNGTPIYEAATQRAAEGLITQAQRRAGWSVKRTGQPDSGVAMFSRAGGGDFRALEVRDDKGRLLAPNGKPSKLNERQWHQVRSPEFKAWFGDWEKHAKADNPVGSLWSDDSVSKVVDENGEPLVVYRGESRYEDFTIFERNKTREESFFFTADNDVARDYAVGQEPRAFFLNAQNVLDLVNDSHEAIDFIREWAATWNNDGWVDRVSGEDIDPVDAVQSGRLFDYEGDWSSRRWRDLQASIEAAGYNGAILPDTHTAGVPFSSIIVFNPTQIKSAASNTGEFSGTNPDIRYSQGRGDVGMDNPGNSPYPLSKDQSAAERLNRGLADHFKDPSWGEAYVQRNLPDSFNAVAEAARAAFGTQVVGVTATGRRFNQFNGVNLYRTAYVNLGAKPSFVNIAGHEIYHSLEKDRPDLHQWFVEQARQFYRNFDEYQAKLNALIGQDEKPYTREKAESELLADFTGDALADPKFLAQLAEADGSKFRRLLNAIVGWLKLAGEKLTGKDLGSSAYFTDVNELRKFLNRALIAYASNKPLNRVLTLDVPTFMTAWHGSPHDHDGFDSSKIDRSAIDTATRRMDKFVTEAEAGRLKDGDTQLLGSTPAVLQMLGAEALQMQIDGETVRKILDGKHGHAMTAALLRQLPEGIYDPLAVFDDPDEKTGAAGKVMITELRDLRGNPVMVAVHLSKQANRMVVNDIASAYGVENFQKRSKIAPSKLEYARNEKALGASTTPDLLFLAGVVQKARELGIKVLSEQDVVNQYGTGFSRGTGFGMALRDLQTVVDRLVPGFKNLPRVHVMESPAALSTKDPAQKALRDFIKKSGAWDDVEGATHEGEIYLFASGMASEERAEHVFATHEITHYGLRGAVGKELDAALQHVWLHNGKVRKAAEAMKKARGLKSNVEAVEEVLADMPDADLVKLTGWRKVVKTIRNWLNKAGAKSLAARLDGWMKAGLSEQEKADLFVADLVTAAREWVRTGKGHAVMTGTRLANPTLADDTARQEKWLHQEATSRGFKTIDDLAEKNYPLFEKLAAMWRKKHPVEDALLSRRTAGFRVVDLFGNGSRVQHFDDKRGLFYEAQKYPSGRTGWRAGEVIDGMDYWLSDKEFGSMEEAQAAVRGLRISSAIKQKNAEKYGAIPALWTGEAKRVAKAIIDAGIGVDRFSASTQSKSKYVYLESGLKVRIADHALPASYDKADIDYRYGSDIKALIAEIKAAEGAPAPSVDPDSAGSRSLGASRNEMQERPAVRADESGSPEEPAQSGGGAGSDTMLSRKVGAGNYRNPQSVVAPKIGGAVADAQKKFAQAGRPMTGLIPEIGAVRENPGNLSDGYKILLPSDLRKFESDESKRQGSQGGAPRLSRAAVQGQQPAQTVAERAEAIIQSQSGTAKPIDTAFKAVTQAAQIDRLTTWAYDKAGFILDRFTPETIKAGVVADYGIPEAVLDERSAMQGRKRKLLRETGALIERLSMLTREESRVAHTWMNNDNPQAAAYFEQQLPPESVRVMGEIKQLIDQLSREAVRLGQLDPEAYKRNRYEYLRRSYKKYVAEQTTGEQKTRQRAIAVLGEQYNNRGMTDAVDMAKIKAAAPEWWGRKLQSGKADKGLKGERFIRLERRAPFGEGTAPMEGIGDRSRGKLLEIAYWPADEKVPAKYAAWDQAGVWEVRDTKGDKIIMWRDFTKQEREMMGEIDEVRFAIARTLHGMIHDVENGKYLEWLGQRYAKKEGEEVEGKVVEASERMRDTFRSDEWVRVPDTKIPGTQVKKYGALAGQFLPGPIWNDVRQVASGRYKPLGETYAAVLTAWKTAKTSLSPGVHMNNVMASVIMADWHDITAGHLNKALRILLAASEQEGKPLAGGLLTKLTAPGLTLTAMRAMGMGHQDKAVAKEIVDRYMDSGGSLGTWAAQELQREQLEPLMEALEAELAKAGDNSPGAQIAAGAIIEHLKAKDIGAAWAAARQSKAGKATANEVQKMIDLYDAEDQIFRLAAWLKAKEASPKFRVGSMMKMAGIAAGSRAGAARRSEPLTLLRCGYADVGSNAAC